MIIQRWQTVALLIAVVMMAIFTFMSLGQVQTESFTYIFTSMGFTAEGIPADGTSGGTSVSTWYFFCLSLLCVIVALIDIFFYKNLSLQIRVCAIEALLIVAAIAVAALLGYMVFDGSSVGWSSAAAAPFIALASTLLARKLMISDRNKLAAADRIR